MISLVQYNMGKKQIITIAVFGLIFAMLYFGCDTKPPSSKAIETSRALNFETISIPALRESEVAKLGDPEKQELQYLEQQVRQTSEEALMNSELEKLSGFWYQQKVPVLAGHYAKKIATAVNEAETWSIAGSTYFICAKQSETEELKTYCLKNAIESFENAAAIEPDDVNQKINLALCYVDFPPEDNPMMGITQLLGLQEKYPESTAVQIQLGRLGIQTGQYDKAIGRLNKVLEMEPNNTKACCFLAQAYEGKGDMESAEQYKACCNK